MESLFTLFAESQRVFSTDRTQSESVSNAIKWLHSQGLIQFDIPITLAFTPQPLYPLSLALIFEGKGTVTWDLNFGLSSILHQLGAQFNHPESKPNLLSIYSILKKTRTNISFQGYLSRQIIEAFPSFSPNDLSLFLSNGLYQNDEDLTLSAVQTVHEFFGSSIISDPSSYCFLTNVISKFPSFIKPVEYLLENNYTFESESGSPFRVCHYALKYSTFKVFQQLISRLGLPIDYELPIGTLSISERPLALNLLECLVALLENTTSIQIHVVSISTRAVRQLLPPSLVPPVCDSAKKEKFLMEKGLCIRQENASYILTLQAGAPSILNQLK